MQFALVSALTMRVGLLCWPSIHWSLAQAYAGAADADRTAIAATFAGLRMFRNVTDVVDSIAAVNNYLLPLWMIIFGVALVRHRRAAPDDFSTADSLTA